MAAGDRSVQAYLHLNSSWQELSVPGSHKHPMVLEGPALPSLHGWRFWTRPDPGIAAGDGLAGEAAASGRASEQALTLAL